MKPPSTGRRSVSKADRIREQELFRYYRPAEAAPATTEPSEVLAVHQASSPDTTLTALAQLVAIRLDVKSVLINVITKDTQYTLSEGTRTLNLGDSRLADDPNDALWIGCGCLAKNEALCENTIALTGVPGGTSPFFTVPDLSKDKRFQDLFYVRSKPNWRFYSGCPLTTKNGVNIGALCILDGKPRSGLDVEQKLFANTIAQTIMKYLEMGREAEERRKGTMMSRALNAFVEGRSRLTTEDYIECGMSPAKDGYDKKNAHTRRRLSNSSSSDVLHGVPPHLYSSDSPSEATTPSQEEAGREQIYGDIDVQQRLTFSRAANLLRESLELHHGGVLFYDTVVGFCAGDSDDSSGSVSTTECAIPDDEMDKSLPTKKRNSQKYNKATFESSLRSESDQKKAGILGKCDGTSIDSPDTKQGRHSFNPIGEKSLQQLIKKYSRGKLWSFDEDGAISSSDEDRMPEPPRKATSNTFERRQSRKVSEAKILQHCFPAVRQLLFVPLWDAGSARFFSGCFAWTTSPLQVFSIETELNFVVAFGNSVMAEVSRLATIAADQQKGDFIGSISHELRSPLHGILASSEFLGETECDSFQKSLVNTIDSCGRTLLDTINHVLDFSKINSFERNFKRKSTRGSSSVTATSEVPQMPQIMNIYATTDIAAVCEEVVEGVYAGQIYQDISSADITDITPVTRGWTFEKGLATSNRALLGGPGAQFATKAVDVVLCIEPGNYVFTTQPGALRRVVMNLVTNSLKYTEKGMVYVKLSLRNFDNSRPEDDESGQILELTVRDTGKGISSQYLRTRLFTPFAQENSLNPGTGLGLSIVRSITNMLGGTIDIRSEVGQGTEVRIELPLLRVTESETPLSTPNTGSSLDRTPDDSIRILQSEASGKSVALYSFTQTSNKPVDAVAVEMEKVLSQYIVNWYGLEVLTALPLSKAPDVIIVDERHLSSLLAESTQRSPIIALCTNAFHPGQIESKGKSQRIEYLSKPFGPYKLARALRLCLDRISSRGGELPPLREILRVDSSGSAVLRSPTIEFESMTLTGEDKTTAINTQTTGTITAGDSENALKALDSSPKGGSISSEKGGRADFPFPSQASAVDQGKPRASITWAESDRPELKARMTEPIVSHKVWPSPRYTAVNEKGKMVTMHTKAPFPTGPEKRLPKILLVDDNQINLRLLKTFMMKREYQLVDSADNGQLAVQAAEMQQDGYDVIFMDISMPVMNGFEATRAIRHIEASRRNGVPSDSAPALIIALTGLASSRDQSEAFTSGVDLFMTKPVSFKEVGRLLNNWEANGGNAGMAAGSTENP